VLWADAVPMADKSAIAATDARHSAEIFRDISLLPLRKTDMSFSQPRGPRNR
jgi:hypothetical protein